MMTSPELPAAIVSMMARREVRMHHYLWHQVRNNWLFWEEDIRQRIRELGWEPPRPALQQSQEGGSEPILDNNSGEDFLYMHNRMIAQVDERLAEICDPDYPRVEGWRSLPAPGDADYPVPPAWDTGDPGFNALLERVKSDEFFQNPMVEWERAFTNPENLSRSTLGQLGAQIEFTIHNMMHVRWSAEVAEIRPDVDPTTPQDIDERWDDPAYDWLGDTYSSHVNPIFWKLHGWVDDRIEDWKTANGVDEIEWTGTWVGQMPEGHEHEDPHALLAATPGTSRGLTAQDHDDHTSRMSELVRTVAGAGRFHHFYDVDPRVLNDTWRAPLMRGKR